MATPLIIRLGAAYSTLAVAPECVWLGKPGLIEVRESRNGSVLGRTKITVEALFALPSGNDVVSCSSQIGYQAPDTVRVERWKLKGSLDDVCERGREPDEWVLRESIEPVDLFHTWSWVPGPVDPSEDGDRIAVFVDTPRTKNRIQVWSVAPASEPVISIPLGSCYPDGILFLRGGNDLVSIECREAEGKSCVSLWSVVSGECDARHDLEYMTVNALCRAWDPRHIVLGLDQSVVFLNVDHGPVEAQIEVDSRPVRKCAFDPQSNHLGLVTDEELVVIDTSTVHRSRILTHFGAKGVDCDLRRHTMAALVNSRDHETMLVLWDLATAKSAARIISTPG